MTTRDTPLSTVKMILLESLLSSTSAFFSSIVILFPGVLIFLRMVLISPLNSSALPGFSLVQAFSIEAMYLPTGGFLGRIAKLGPLDNIFFCASVRGYWISYVPICRSWSFSLFLFLFLSGSLLSFWLVLWLLSLLDLLELLELLGLVSKLFSSGIT